MIDEVKRSLMRWADDRFVRKMDLRRIVEQLRWRFADLIGINVSSAAEGDLLVYDAGDSEWKNTKTVSEGLTVRATETNVPVLNLGPTAMVEDGVSYSPGFHRGLHDYDISLFTGQLYPDSDVFLSSVYGDSARRFTLSANGSMAWGPGNGTLDVNLRRSEAGILRTSGKVVADEGMVVRTPSPGTLLDVSPLTLTEGSSTFGTGFYRGPADDEVTASVVRSSHDKTALVSGVTGDSFRRFLISADGSMGWGPGNATRDTGLSREAAGRLLVGGDLHVTGNVYRQEGTWTPVLTASGTQPTNIGYGARAGRYQVIGNLVFFSFSITLNAFTLGPGTGDARVSLPILVPNNTLSRGAGIAHCINVGFDASVQSLLFYPINNTSTGGFQGMRTGAGVYQIRIGDLAANSDLRVSGFYWFN